MKKFLFSITLLFLGISMSQAQMIKFAAQANIVEGPYIELKEDGYNLYSWYKKTGYKSKKLGSFSSGDDEILVTMLEIQRFDAQGKAIETENHAVQLDEGNGLIGKYEIHDKPVLKSGRKVFASGDDLTFRELVKKFPKSRAHSGAGVKAGEKTTYTIIKLSGKGLLGGKKPYHLKIEKSDEEDNKVELADISTGDPKAEWKTTSNTYGFINDDKVIFPTWYQKHDKKDKYGFYKYYKLAAYDEAGKMVVDTDVNFEMPNELYKTMYVYNKAGKTQGFLYIFGEQYGLGWKKINPEPQKDLNTLYWFDNDKLNEPIELRTRAKGNYPGAPSVLKAISGDDGIRLFIPRYKNKKLGITESLSEFLCKDGKSELVKSHEFKDIVKSTGGEITSRFISSVPNMDKMIELNDGGIMYMGYSRTKSDAGVTYGDCLYLTTNSDGSLKNIGRVESGATASAKSPRIGLEKLDGDKVLIKINNRSNGTELWIFDAASNEFTNVKPAIKMEVKEIMRKENTIYFIGVTNAEKREWVVDKFEL